MLVLAVLVHMLKYAPMGPTLPSEMLFEIDEAYEATSSPMYFALRDQAQEFVFQCWLHELQSSERHRNTQLVAQLTSNNPSVSGEMVTKELPP